MGELSIRRRVHPAWWVAAVTFLALVGAAGFRAAPGILMDPLHREFGWSVSTISLAVAVNMALYGLTAPFAAALMERFGIRKVVTAALLERPDPAALRPRRPRPRDARRHRRRAARARGAVRRGGHHRVGPAHRLRRPAPAAGPLRAARGVTGGAPRTEPRGSALTVPTRTPRPAWAVVVGPSARSST